MTLDIVKNTLWVDAEAYTTSERALNADASFVAPVVDGLPEEPSSSSGPITRSFQTARAPRESSAEYLDSSSPVEDMRKTVARVTSTGVEYKNTNFASSAGESEKRLSIDTWKIKRCLTDDVTWRTQSAQQYQGP